MKRHLLFPLGIVLLAGVAALLPAPAKTAAAATERAYLPDSFVLARVDGKPIRVKDFVATYFVSYAEFRPRPDSAGRVEFLNTMINKEVMARTALADTRPLSFTDRLRMRHDTETILANTLFQRAVLDSATVTEDELQAAYESYKYDQHLRQIIFDDPATAARVRGDLLAKKIQWDDAVKRYHHADRDTARGSDLGWLPRMQVDPAMATMVYALEPGQISPVISDRTGYRIVQSVERRPARVPPFTLMRRKLRNEIATRKGAVLAGNLQRQVGASVGLVYDSTNIAWAADRFQGRRVLGLKQGAPTIEVDTSVPEFAAADTGRVLARYRDGQLSLGSFLHAYTDLSPLSRPTIDDVASFESQVDAIVLAPYLSKLAVARGLDRDSMAVAAIAQRREQMMVERMYQDSIAFHVSVTPRLRRKYYDDHIAQYHTYANVRFAAIVRRSQAAADSVAAALKAGTSPEAILRADSLAGQVTGSIKELREDDHGTPYYNILFHELRPGQTTVVGPDQQGDWLTLQVLAFDPGRQLSFEEAEVMIDESVQNLQAEKLLAAFLARQRKRHKIEAHPELVMRIRLEDPTADQ